ncbi:MAG: hypothetical protein H6581_08115 [Bacteroidia bacterium]|nr:hypothetical protein [Bacteroidia bacterium]
MRNLNKLIPGFLKKADLYLLENHPAIWVSKIHYVAFFAVSLISLVALWQLALPMNFASPSDYETFFFVMFIPSLIGAVIWALFQFIFNAEKNYGKAGNLSDFGRLGLNLLALSMFLSIPWASGMITNFKVSNSISRGKFVEEINDLNRGYLLFTARPREENYEEYYSFPLTPYSFYDANLLSERELMDLDFSKRTWKEAAADLEKFQTLYHKYGGWGSFNENDILTNYFEGNRYDNSYLIDNEYEVESNLQAIANAKNWNIFLVDWDVILALLFTVFCLSVLLIIIKNVTLKHFLIATIAGLLLIPLLGIVGVIGDEMDLGRDENIISWAALAVFLFAGWQSFSIFRLKKFSGFKAVSLILFNVALPFIVFFGAAFIDINDSLFSYDYHHYHLREHDILGLLYAGAGMYAFGWVFVLKRLYRKLQSLPVN